MTKKPKTLEKICGQFLAHCTNTLSRQMALADVLGKRGVKLLEEMDEALDKLENDNRTLEDQIGERSRGRQGR